MALMFPSNTARAAVRSSSGAWARIAVEAASRARASSRRMNLLRSAECTLTGVQRRRESNMEIPWTEDVDESAASERAADDAMCRIGDAPGVAPDARLGPNPKRS